MLQNRLVKSLYTITMKIITTKAILRYGLGRPVVARWNSSLWNSRVSGKFEFWLLVLGSHIFQKFALWWTSVLYLSYSSHSCTKFQSPIYLSIQFEQVFWLVNKLFVKIWNFGELGICETHVVNSECNTFTSWA